MNKVVNELLHQVVHEGNLFVVFLHLPLPEKNCRVLCRFQDEPGVLPNLPKMHPDHHYRQLGLVDLNLFG